MSNNFNQDNATYIEQPNSNHVPKIQLSGDLLSEIEYENLADFRPEDMDTIAEDWLKFAPSDFEQLLNAD